MTRAEIDEHEPKKTEGASSEALDAELTTECIDSEHVRMTLPNEACDVELGEQLASLFIIFENGGKRSVCAMDCN